MNNMRDLHDAVTGGAVGRVSRKYDRLRNFIRIASDHVVARDAKPAPM